ncbi:hypothetical protein B0181_04045 [Moraxella caviae]|uniref:Type II secretion system protein H n=1 Tax=Moraxella caviae TaxID=34060 RepID=A0A1T0A5R2_9GAMM|nr:GspH/FimT family pseudopilin [Moraxella caviae]OOR90909.1 hypothetical protein B0181_04045 [Moraxella caviae]STZ10206.1 putative major pilin subunit [Moraxella caviae]
MANQGFTLLEMVVVLAIVAVLALFAMPAYDGMMQRLESQATKRHIQEAIRLAKIESIAQGKDVIICAMDDAQTCNKTGQKDFVVFVDRNMNNRFDDKDFLISRQPLSLKYGYIDMRSSLGRHHMKFMGDNGKPRGHYGHIKYCTENQNLAYQVVMNAHGVLSERRGNLEKIDC